MVDGGEGINFELLEYWILDWFYKEHEYVCR